MYHLQPRRLNVFTKAARLRTRVGVFVAGFAAASLVAAGCNRATRHPGYILSPTCRQPAECDADRPVWPAAGKLQVGRTSSADREINHILGYFLVGSDAYEIADYSQNADPSKIAGGAEDAGTSKTLLSWLRANLREL